jgi:hypothetical protein
MTWENQRYGFTGYLPAAKSLWKTALALHEYWGLLFYRIYY